LNTEQLLAIVVDETRDVSARFEAGDALAELGDPRLEDDGMVAVPPGTLHHKPSKDAPIEQRPVAGFSIQRYPVTVAAFAAFIDDGGYDDPALWSPRGWEWRLDQDAEAPRFWGEDEWAPYLVPNHPVVGANAFEAEAYASWRSWRLPSEDEWERACRGDDARDYPWGPAWREDACAHRTHGPRCTSPIGIYPAGVSPFGVWELVGCVWQWTQDGRGAAGQYGPARAVRGGAWNNLPWSVGSAGRNAYPPQAQFSNLGFRCVADDSSTIASS
jgi:gamma-glutamyl hercynylcysteine S-oxide synthase